MSTPTQPGLYSIAGVVVRTRPEALSEVTARLAGLPGVDVHHTEAATGRVVITLETDRPDHEQAHLERVRLEPGVLSADLVYHYVEPPGPEHARTPPDAGAPGGALVCPR